MSKPKRRSPAKNVTPDEPDPGKEVKVAHGKKVHPKNVTPDEPDPGKEVKVAHGKKVHPKNVTPDEPDPGKEVKVAHGKKVHPKNVTPDEPDSGEEVVHHKVARGKKVHPKAVDVRISTSDGIVGVRDGKGRKSPKDAGGNLKVRASASDNQVSAGACPQHRQKKHRGRKTKEVHEVEKKEKRSLHDGCRTASRVQVDDGDVSWVKAVSDVQRGDGEKVSSSTNTKTGKAHGKEIVERKELDKKDKCGTITITNPKVDQCQEGQENAPKKTFISIAKNIWTFLSPQPPKRKIRPPRPKLTPKNGPLPGQRVFELRMKEKNCNSSDKDAGTVRKWNVVKERINLDQLIALKKGAKENKFDVLHTRVLKNTSSDDVKGEKADQGMVEEKATTRNKSLTRKDVKGRECTVELERGHNRQVEEKASRSKNEGHFDRGDTVPKQDVMKSGAPRPVAEKKPQRKKQRVVEQIVEGAEVKKTISDVSRGNRGQLKNVDCDTQSDKERRLTNRDGKNVCVRGKIKRGLKGRNDGVNTIRYHICPKDCAGVTYTLEASELTKSKARGASKHLLKSTSSPTKDMKETDARVGDNHYKGQTRGGYKQRVNSHTSVAMKTKERDQKDRGKRQKSLPRDVSEDKLIKKSSPTEDFRGDLDNVVEGKRKKSKVRDASKPNAKSTLPPDEGIKTEVVVELRRRNSKPRHGSKLKGKAISPPDEGKTEEFDEGRVSKQKPIHVSRSKEESTSPPVKEKRDPEEVGEIKRGQSKPRHSSKTKIKTTMPPAKEKKKPEEVGEGKRSQSKPRHATKLQVKSTSPPDEGNPEEFDEGKVKKSKRVHDSKSKMNSTSTLDKETREPEEVGDRKRNQSKHRHTSKAKSKSTSPQSKEIEPEEVGEGKRSQSKPRQSSKAKSKSTSPQSKEIEPEAVGEGKRSQSKPRHGAKLKVKSTLPLDEENPEEFGEEKLSKSKSRHASKPNEKPASPPNEETRGQEEICERKCSRSSKSRHASKPKEKSASPPDEEIRGQEEICERKFSKSSKSRHASKPKEKPALPPNEETRGQEVCERKCSRSSKSRHASKPNGKSASPPDEETRGQEEVSERKCSRSSKSRHASKPNGKSASPPDEEARGQEEVSERKCSRSSKSRHASKPKEKPAWPPNEETRGQEEVCERKCSRSSKSRHASKPKENSALPPDEETRGQEEVCERKCSRSSKSRHASKPKENSASPPNEDKHEREEVGGGKRDKSKPLHVSKSQKSSTLTPAKEKLEPEEVGGGKRSKSKPRNASKPPKKSALPQDEEKHEREEVREEKRGKSKSRHALKSKEKSISPPDEGIKAEVTDEGKRKKSKSRDSSKLKVISTSPPTKDLKESAKCSEFKCKSSKGHDASSRTVKSSKRLMEEVKVPNPKRESKLHESKTPGAHEKRAKSTSIPARERPTKNLNTATVLELYSKSSINKNTSRSAGQATSVEVFSSISSRNMKEVCNSRSKSSGYAFSNQPKVQVDALPSKVSIRRLNREKSKKELLATSTDEEMSTCERQRKPPRLQGKERNGEDDKTVSKSRSSVRKINDKKSQQKFDAVKEIITVKSNRCFDMSEASNLKTSQTYAEVDASDNALPSDEIPEGVCQDSKLSDKILRDIREEAKRLGVLTPSAYRFLSNLNEKISNFKEGVKRSKSLLGSDKRLSSKSLETKKRSHSAGKEVSTLKLEKMSSLKTLQVEDDCDCAMENKKSQEDKSMSSKNKTKSDSRPSVKAKEEVVRKASPAKDGANKEVNERKNTPVQNNILKGLGGELLTTVMNDRRLLENLDALVESVLTGKPYKGKARVENKKAKPYRRGTRWNLAEEIDNKNEANQQSEPDQEQEEDNPRAKESSKDRPSGKNYQNNVETDIYSLDVSPFPKKFLGYLDDSCLKTSKVTRKTSKEPYKRSKAKEHRDSCSLSSKNRNSRFVMTKAPIYLYKKPLAKQFSIPSRPTLESQKQERNGKPLHNKETCGDVCENKGDWVIHLTHSKTSEKNKKSTLKMSGEKPDERVNPILNYKSGILPWKSHEEGNFNTDPLRDAEWRLEDETALRADKRRSTPRSKVSDDEQDGSAVTKVVPPDIHRKAVEICKRIMNNKPLHGRSYDGLYSNIVEELLKSAKSARRRDRFEMDTCTTVSSNTSPRDQKYGKNSSRNSCHAPRKLSSSRLTTAPKTVCQPRSKLKRKSKGKSQTKIYHLSQEEVSHLFECNNMKTSTCSIDSNSGIQNEDELLSEEIEVDDQDLDMDDVKYSMEINYPGDQVNKGIKDSSTVKTKLKDTFKYNGDKYMDVSYFVDGTPSFSEFSVNQLKDSREDDGNRLVSASTLRREESRSMNALEGSVDPGNVVSNVSRTGQTDVTDEGKRKKSKSRDSSKLKIIPPWSTKVHRPEVIEKKPKLNYDKSSRQSIKTQAVLMENEDMPLLEATKERRVNQEPTRVNERRIKDMKPNSPLLQRRVSFVEEKGNKGSEKFQTRVPAQDALMCMRTKVPPLTKPFQATSQTQKKTVGGNKKLLTKCKADDSWIRNNTKNENVSYETKVQVSPNNKDNTHTSKERKTSSKDKNTQLDRCEFTGNNSLTLKSLSSRKVLVNYVLTDKQSKPADKEDQPTPSPSSPAYSSRENKSKSKIQLRQPLNVKPSKKIMSRHKFVQLTEEINVKQDKTPKTDSMAKNLQNGSECLSKMTTRNASRGAGAEKQSRPPMMPRSKTYDFIKPARESVQAIEAQDSPNVNSAKRNTPSTGTRPKSAAPKKFPFLRKNNTKVVLNTKPLPSHNEAKQNKLEDHKTCAGSRPKCVEESYEVSKEVTVASHSVQPKVSNMDSVKLNNQISNRGMQPDRTLATNQRQMNKLSCLRQKRSKLNINRSKCEKKLQTQKSKLQTEACPSNSLTRKKITPSRAAKLKVKAMNTKLKEEEEKKDCKCSEHLLEPSKVATLPMVAKPHKVMNLFTVKHVNDQKSDYGLIPEKTLVVGQCLLKKSSANVTKTEKALQSINKLQTVSCSSNMATRRKVIPSVPVPTQTVLMDRTSRVQECHESECAFKPSKVATVPMLAKLHKESHIYNIKLDNQPSVWELKADKSIAATNKEQRQKSPPTTSQKKFVKSHSSLGGAEKLPQHQRGKLQTQPVFKVATSKQITPSNKNECPKREEFTSHTSTLRGKSAGRSVQQDNVADVDDNKKVLRRTSGEYCNSTIKNKRQAHPDEEVHTSKHESHRVSSHFNGRVKRAKSAKVPDKASPLTARVLSREVQQQDGALSRGVEDRLGNSSGQQLNGLGLPCTQLSIPIVSIQSRGLRKNIEPRTSQGGELPSTPDQKHHQAEYGHTRVRGDCGKTCSNRQNVVSRRMPRVPSNIIRSHSFVALTKSRSRSSPSLAQDSISKTSIKLKPVEGKVFASSMKIKPSETHKVVDARELTSKITNLREIPSTNGRDNQNRTKQNCNLTNVRVGAARNEHKLEKGIGASCKKENQTKPPGNFPTETSSWQKKAEEKQDWWKKNGNGFERKVSKTSEEIIDSKSSSNQGKSPRYETGTQDLARDWGNKGSSNCYNFNSNQDDDLRRATGHYNDSAYMFNQQQCVEYVTSKGKMLEYGYTGDRTSEEYLAHQRGIMFGKRNHEGIKMRNSSPSNDSTFRYNTQDCEQRMRRRNETNGRNNYSAPHNGACYVESKNFVKHNIEMSAQGVTIAERNREAARKSADRRQSYVSARNPQGLPSVNRPIYDETSSQVGPISEEIQNSRETIDVDDDQESGSVLNDDDDMSGESDEVDSTSSRSSKNQMDVYIVKTREDKPMAEMRRRDEGPGSSYERNRYAEANNRETGLKHTGAIPKYRNQDETSSCMFMPRPSESGGAASSGMLSSPCDLSYGNIHEKERAKMNLTMMMTPRHSHGYHSHSNHLGLVDSRSTNPSNSDGKVSNYESSNELMTEFRERQNGNRENDSCSCTQEESDLSNKDSGAFVVQYSDNRKRSDEKYYLSNEESGCSGSFRSFVQNITSENLQCNGTPNKSSRLSAYTSNTSEGTANDEVVCVSEGSTMTGGSEASCFTVDGTSSFSHEESRSGTRSDVSKYSLENVNRNDESLMSREGATNNVASFRWTDVHGDRVEMPETQSSKTKQNNNGYVNLITPSSENLLAHAVGSKKLTREQQTLKQFCKTIQIPHGPRPSSLTIESHDLHQKPRVDKVGRALNPDSTEPFNKGPITRMPTILSENNGRALKRDVEGRTVQRPSTQRDSMGSEIQLENKPSLQEIDLPRSKPPPPPPPLPKPTSHTREQHQVVEDYETPMQGDTEGRHNGRLHSKSRQRKDENVTNCTNLTDQRIDSNAVKSNVKDNGGIGSRTDMKANTNKMLNVEKNDARNIIRTNGGKCNGAKLTEAPSADTNLNCFYGKTYLNNNSVDMTDKTSNKRDEKHAKEVDRGEKKNACRSQNSKKPSNVKSKNVQEKQLDKTPSTHTAYIRQLCEESMDTVEKIESILAEPRRKNAAKRAYPNEVPGPSRGREGTDHLRSDMHGEKVPVHGTAHQDETIRPIDGRCVGTSKIKDTGIKTRDVEPATESSDCTSDCSYECCSDKHAGIPSTLAHSRFPTQKIPPKTVRDEKTSLIAKEENIYSLEREIREHTQYFEQGDKQGLEITSKKNDTYKPSTDRSVNAKQFSVNDKKLTRGEKQSIETTPESALKVLDTVYTNHSCKTHAPSEDALKVSCEKNSPLFEIITKTVDGKGQVKNYLKIDDCLKEIVVSGDRFKLSPKPCALEEFESTPVTKALGRPTAPQSRVVTAEVESRMQRKAHTVGPVNDKIKDGKRKVEEVTMSSLIQGKLTNILSPLIKDTQEQEKKGNRNTKTVASVTIGKRNRGPSTESSESGSRRESHGTNHSGRESSVYEETSGEEEESDESHTESSDETSSGRESGVVRRRRSRLDASRRPVESQPLTTANERRERITHSNTSNTSFESGSATAPSTEGSGTATGSSHTASGGSPARGRNSSSAEGSSSAHVSPKQTTRLERPIKNKDDVLPSHDQSKRRELHVPPTVKDKKLAERKSTGSSSGADLDKNDYAPALDMRKKRSVSRGTMTEVAKIPSDTRKHSDEARKHSDETRKHSDEARKHSDEARKHSDETRKHSDETRKYSGDSRRQTEDSTLKQTGDTRKDADTTRRQAEDSTHKQTKDTRKYSGDTRKDADTSHKQTEDTRKHADSTQKQTEDIRKHADSAQKQTEDIRKHADSTQKQTEDIRKHADSTQKQTEDIRKHADSAQKQIEDTRKYADSTQKQTEDIRKHADSAYRQIEDTRKYADSAQKQIKDTRKYADSAQKQIEDTRKYADSTQKQTEGTRKYTDSAQKQIEDTRKHSEDTRKHADSTQKQTEGNRKQTDSIQTQTDDNRKHLSDEKKASSSRLPPVSSEASPNLISSLTHRRDPKINVPIINKNETKVIEKQFNDDNEKIVSSKKNSTKYEAQKGDHEEKVPTENKHETKTGYQSSNIKDDVSVPKRQSTHVVSDRKETTDHHSGNDSKNILKMIYKTDKKVFEDTESIFFNDEDIDSENQEFGIHFDKRYLSDSSEASFKKTKPKKDAKDKSNKDSKKEQRKARARDKKIANENLKKGDSNVSQRKKIFSQVGRWIGKRIDKI